MITLIPEELTNQNQLIAKMKMLADVALENGVIDHEQYEHITTSIKAVKHDWNR